MTYIVEILTRIWRPEDQRFEGEDATRDEWVAVYTHGWDKNVAHKRGINLTNEERPAVARMHYHHSHRKTSADEYTYFAEGVEIGTGLALSKIKAWEAQAEPDYSVHTARLSSTFEFKLWAEYSSKIVAKQAAREKSASYHTGAFASDAANPIASYYNRKIAGFDEFRELHEQFKKDAERHANFLWGDGREMYDLRSSLEVFTGWDDLRVTDLERFRSRVIAIARDFNKLAAALPPEKASESEQLTKAAIKLLEVEGELL